VQCSGSAENRTPRTEEENKRQLHLRNFVEEKLQQPQNTKERSPGRARREKGRLGGTIEQENPMATENQRGREPKLIGANPKMDAGNKNPSERLAAKKILREMSPAQRTPNKKQITRKPKRAAASSEHETRSALHEFPWLNRKPGARERKLARR
jgi:hypothetical protein